MRNAVRQLKLAWYSVSKSPPKDTMRCPGSTSKAPKARSSSASTASRPLRVLATILNLFSIIICRMCAGGFRDRHRGCYRHSVLLICKINQKRRDSRRHDAKKSLNTLAYFDTEHLAARPHSSVFEGAARAAPHSSIRAGYTPMASRP